MDRIVLTIPREREFGAVADLVIAGLGSRHDFTVEAIDDMQLALETLVEHDEQGDELTVRLEIEDGTLEAVVGPFERDAITAELQARGDDGSLGLRRVLETTVDTVRIAEHDNGCWVELRKTVGG